MSRILALVTDAYGGRGGIAQAARDVIGGLASSDTVEVIEVLPRHVPDSANDLPLKVRQYSAAPDRFGFAARALGRTMIVRPDFVFCNHLYMAPLAAILARIVSAKLIIQLHGIEIWSEPTPAQRKALEQADLLLCVSRDTRARALTHCDLRPERAVVVNNTVDPRFAPGDRAAARAKFGLGGEFALLIVGRLDPHERYKGHDRVIAALADLSHPDGRPILFLIAGDGGDRERLQTAADTIGVKERTRFLGQIPAVDLPDLYRAADLFVLPSTGEGFGIVFLEAMACGTLAFGLAAGGAPDALANGELGVLAPPEADFAITLYEAIIAPGSDRNELAAAVQARFGAATFKRRLVSALDLLH